ncbi:MAG: hypothetical protein ACLRX9_03560 [Streptococcus salivarius]
MLIIIWEWQFLNALAAIEVGCDFIDASILGYGKSSGNLSLELLLSLMRRQNFIYKWNITKILSLANQLTTVVRKSGFISRNLKVR